MAKRADAQYVPGKRDGMLKIKRVRTIDYRDRRLAPRQGRGHSRFADPGPVRPRGRAAGGRAHLRRSAPKRARELVDELAEYESGESGTAAPSRWTADRDLEWRSLRPELVVEVSFDHKSGHRIRHGAKLLRFRTDREPASCHISQLES